MLTSIRIRWLLLANAINLVEEMKGRYRWERERENVKETERILI